MIGEIGQQFGSSSAERWVQCSGLLGLCGSENMDKTMDRAGAVSFMTSAVPAGKSSQAVGSTSSSSSMK